MALFRVRNKKTTQLTLEALGGDTLTIPGLGVVTVEEKFITYKRPSAADADITDLSTGTPVSPEAPGPSPIYNLNATTRLYDWTAIQRVPAAAGSAVSTEPFEASEVMLMATVMMFVLVGDTNSIIASQTDGIPLIPGEKFHLRINPGQYIAAIREGAETGTLYILPVAS